MDDTKLCVVASILEDRIRIQNTFDKLEKSSEINLMIFSAGKCKALYLEENNQVHKYKVVNN